jgi:hypothetical protein
MIPMGTREERLNSQLDTIDVATEDAEAVLNGLGNLRAQVEEGFTASPVEGEEYCTVTLTRPGKQTQTVQLAVGSTVNSFMKKVGWDPAGHNFKLTGIGSASPTDVQGDFRVGAGEWVLYAGPQVKGGVIL